MGKKSNTRTGQKFRALSADLVKNFMYTHFDLERKIVKRNRNGFQKSLLASCCPNPLGDLIPYSHAHILPPNAVTTLLVSFELLNLRLSPTGKANAFLPSIRYCAFV
jgi:hypothetical protein